MPLTTDHRPVLCPPYASDQRWDGAVVLAELVTPTSSALGSYALWEMAVTYRAAHILACADRAADAGGHSVAGPLTGQSEAGTETEMGWAASYDTSLVTDDLSSTTYGQQYQGLIARSGLIAGPMFVRGEA